MNKIFQDNKTYESEIVIQEFKNYFNSKGYQPIENVLVTSNIDPTVRFIGSHISVMKDRLMNQAIDDRGEYMSQNCLRTRNVKTLMEDTSTKYGSFFKSMGSLVQYKNLEAIVEDSFELLEEKLNIPMDNIVCRVNSADEDLVRVLKKIRRNNLEFDTKQESYYKHNIGIVDVFGRNFNFAVDNKKGNVEDIGNLIVLQDQNNFLGVELALGDSTLAKELMGLKHILDIYKIEIDTTNENAKRKIQDCIITISVLIGEGLMPNSSTNQGRILKKYIKELLYWCDQIHLSQEKLNETVEEFCTNYLKLPLETIQTILNTINQK